MRCWLDHLVGAPEQCSGRVKAERLSRLELDHSFAFALQRPQPLSVVPVPATSPPSHSMNMTRLALARGGGPLPCLGAGLQVNSGRQHPAVFGKQDFISGQTGRPGQSVENIWPTCLFEFRRLRRGPTHR